MNTTVDIVVVITVTGGIIKYLVDHSKCTEMKFCFGLFSLKRDVSAEVNTVDTSTTLEEGLNKCEQTPSRQ